MKILLFIPVFMLMTLHRTGTPVTLNHYTTAKADSVLPSKILDLTNWKLTLPIPGNNDNPAEIKQPALASYSNVNYFFASDNNKAVAFRANAGGNTTHGSNFPRSELREMADGGKTQASWSSSVGKHTLFIDQKITHLPDVKDQVVVGQIHDATKYVIFFRLEHHRLFVSVKNGGTYTLDDNYKLGTRFSVKFVVNNDETQCYYNEKLMYTYKGNFSGAYFKAGAYVQSVCHGKAQTPGELCDAYGQVEIYNVWVKHE